MRVACTVLILLSCYMLGQDKPVFESVRAEHGAALNTAAESPFWRAARPIYAESDNNGGVLPEYRTEIRSRWTDTDIYFLFICPYKQLYLKPSPNVHQETYELWNWNVAEVFIGSDFADIKRYKEFEVSPHNEWIALGVHDPRSPCGFEHAARIDEKSHVWYMAMRIPLNALGGRPVKAGNTFRVNFFRTEAGPQNSKEIVWQPVMGASFHVPERFALLRLSSR